MKTLTTLTIALALYSSTVFADQFVTQTINLSSKKYDSTITFQKLLNPSVPAFEKINKQLVADLKENGCDAQDAATSENGYSYNASARIVAINQNYVGYQVTADNYCGGAHPNYSTYHLTFDSKSGALVKMGTEFPVQDEDAFNNPKYDEYRKFLAKLIYKKIKGTADAECYLDSSAADKDQAAIDMIADFWPAISGLAQNKSIVLRTNPPHAATVCALGVRVSYAEIKAYLAKNSKLHSWLQ